MTTPAEGLANILEAANIIGGTSGWADRVGGFGSESKAVTLIDSGGRGGEVKVAIDYPSVQVIVRGEKTSGGYVAARDKAQEIYDALMGIDTPNVTWPQLTSCVAVNNPAWLGRDESDRPRFSVNFKLIVEPDNAGNRTY